MTAFMIGWGVFWLMLWCAALVVFLLPPHKSDDITAVAVCLVGAVVSVAFLASVFIGRALS